MKSVTLRRPALREELRRYLLAFLLGFGSLLVVILPIIIADGGYYIYYGDYNSQQIPFYNLANDAVRSGSFGWNWYTDLGVNFIGSYAFYLLGSPFFWLTTILPRSWVTFAMPVLLCMKHGIASLTAYAYIRRFAQCPSRCLRNASTPAMENMGRYPPMEAHFPKSEENRFGRAGTSGIRNRLNRIRQIRVRSL